MSEPFDIDYIKPYIEATIASSSRFRRVLLVVIIASILAFGAFWNSRKGSWINSRVNLAHQAESYFSLKGKEEQLALQMAKKNLALKGDEDKLNGTLDEKARGDVIQDKVSLTKDRDALSEEIKRIDDKLNKDYVNATKWINDRNFTSKDQITPITAQLETMRVEYVSLIRIPFFGIVLDVNDLGLLGGFTFIVILMWFRFSLWREYYNLRTTFKEVKSEHLKFCYRTLAMNQVLTVPPALSQNQPQEKPWGPIVRLLYFLPVMVQLIVFAYDCVSFNTGWIINEFNTIFGTSVSLFFLGLSVMLTYWCYRLSDEIDKEWDRAFDRLKEQLKNTPDNPT